MNNCLWCDKPISSKYGRKFCNHSHRQLYFAKTHPAYYQRQLDKQRRKNSKGVKLAKNLLFIQAAQILQDEDIAHI